MGHNRTPANEMAQRVKELTAKPGTLNLIPRTHKVEREKTSSSCVLTSTTCVPMRAYLCPSPNLFCPFSSQMAGTLTKVSLDGNCS